MPGKPKKELFFERAYNSHSPDEIMALYDDWAESYDEVIQANGYVTPRRCAEALAQLEPDRDVPVLDIGCGTGMSGLALLAEGFTNIHGSEVNAKMLKTLSAREAESGAIYRSTHLVSADNPFNFAPGTYRHITAMGVIATGHAPASTIRNILALLETGGLLVFSLNDHTLEDAPYPETVDAVVAENIAAIAFDEYGDHLPGIDLKARVLALRKV